jgi:hypothetical protein
MGACFTDTGTNMTGRRRPAGAGTSGIASQTAKRLSASYCVLSVFVVLFVRVLRAGRLNRRVPLSRLVRALCRARSRAWRRR